ncbi:exonuclease 3'-5' domain-containing protein 1 [Plakobranchus ocellatus]|uniref:Exonuclease 3'-5' domain-containing protein 1 n=1 Tax=Plakobranchus ocellatus TaxID=259542 RepID=A0AAV4DUM8_9GAST|nr:exonuclease 3'-5' domain-containing protein 1 [Plakobranchus ocellatus]
MDCASRSNSKSALQSINLPKSCRVTITIGIANGANSSFTGIVHSVDQTSGKIILKNVTTAGVKLSGPQIYYCKDILDLQIVSDVQDATESSIDKKKARKTNKDFRQRKQQPSHLNKLKNLDDEELVLSNIFRDELDEQDSEEDVFEDFYVTEECTLICRVCDKFYDAIEYIMEQEAVGVAVDGQRLGRDGTLSLVQIATDSELIVFDILRLGDEAFKAGLQAVFEAEDVMKVIHDCRWLADLLRWQYDVTMVNIFDTQVANAFVYRSRNDGDWPRYVESLPGCLINYLNLSPQDVQFTKVRERFKDKDEAVWLVRPLSPRLLTAATKNTVHLLRLQRVLLVEMLAEFKAAVEIYLTHVTGTADDVEKCRLNSHLLPIAFTYIHNYVSGRPHTTRGRSDTECSDRKGFRENNVTLPDNLVVFSHDSVWHRPYLTHRGLSKKSELDGSLNKPRMAVAPAEEKGKTHSHLGPRPGDDRQLNSLADEQSAEMNGSLLSQREQTQERVAASSLNHSSPESSSPAAIKNNEGHQCKRPALKKVVCERVTSVESIAQTCSRMNLSTVSAAECVSESESETASNTSIQSTGSLLQKSGLWKMKFDKQQGKVSSTPSGLSNGHLDLARKASHFESPAESVARENPPPMLPDCQLSEKEKEQALEMRHQLALLDQLHFVSATATQDSLSESSHTSSPPARRQENHDMPELTKVSQQASSVGSSDSDGSHAFVKLTEADLRREKNLDMSALMPAGMQETKTRKSKEKRPEAGPTMAPRTEQCVQDTRPAPGAAKELDFSLIPTPQSLLLRKEHSLGVSPIGIGNPFSEDEGFSTPSMLSSSALRQANFVSHGGREETISDDELDKMLKSERSQRILKLVSLKSTTNVREKILPVPAKVKSPSCGS